MADMKVPKQTDADEANGPAGLDPEMSDSDIDQFLAEDDPDFLKSIAEISKDKSLSLSQIIISEGQQALNDEKDAWKASGRLGRTVYAIFPWSPHISLRFRKLRILLFDFLRAEWVRAKNLFYFLVKTGFKKVVLKVKEVGHNQMERYIESQRNFRYLSWKLKLSFFGIVLLMAGTVFFIYRSLTHGVIPIGEELFIPSMERVATKVYEYNPQTEVEPFYENLRSSSNMILLPKMVVNLRSSVHSGNNPMGVFEFYLEGMVPEVVIEIKDREVEIRDRMQRTVEEFTFDHADSPDGKKLITEKLKKEVNQVLTTGKLKKIWIKTIIVKP